MQTSTRDCAECFEHQHQRCQCGCFCSTTSISRSGGCGNRQRRLRCLFLQIALSIHAQLGHGRGLEMNIERECALMKWGRLFDPIAQQRIGRQAGRNIRRQSIAQHKIRHYNSTILTFIWRIRLLQPTSIYTFATLAPWERPSSFPGLYVSCSTPLSTSCRFDLALQKTTLSNSQSPRPIVVPWSTWKAHIAATPDGAGIKIVLEPSVPQPGSGWRFMQPMPEGGHCPITYKMLELSPGPDHKIDSITANC